MSIRSAAANRARRVGRIPGCRLRWINWAFGNEPSLCSKRWTDSSDEQYRTSARVVTGRRWSALCGPQESLSPERVRDVPPDQMGPDGVLPGRLLPAAVRALESRSRRAGSGGAGRFAEQPLLFLLHRAVAAGGLLFHGAVDRRRDHAVPDELDRRPHLVRISLSANGVDGSVLCRRAADRGRSA